MSKKGRQDFVRAILSCTAIKIDVNDAAGPTATSLFLVSFHGADLSNKLHSLSAERPGFCATGVAGW